MKSRDFCYWLQGWFELNKTVDHREGASKETLELIEKHLSMVFLHEIDPSFPEGQKQKLDAAHSKLQSADWQALGPGHAFQGEPLMRC